MEKQVSVVFIPLFHSPMEHATHLHTHTHTHTHTHSVNKVSCSQTACQMFVAGKHGLPPEETVVTVKHIVSQCSALHFLGLMTIGRYGYDLSLGPNPDFQVQKSLWTKPCVFGGQLWLLMGRPAYCMAVLQAKTCKMRDKIVKCFLLR